MLGLNSLIHMIRIRDTILKLRDFAGVEIVYGGERLCIDILYPLQCDYILYTHNHPRHSPDSILLERFSDRIYSLFYGNKIKIGERIKISDHFIVESVEAFSWRYPEYHSRGSGAGFIVESDLRIYHTGDSDLSRDILSSVRGGVDVLIIPIEGLGVYTPEEAVEVVRSLRPPISIPIHFQDIDSFYIFRDMAQPYTQVVLLGRERSG